MIREEKDVVTMKPATFGQYVTTVRQECGYSIRQLAERLKVAPSTISRLETGARSLPHPDLFLGVVDALDLDITTALGLVGPYGRLCAEVARRQRRGT
jgi:transcriptional regulator with XRE-family HTH domain